MAQPAMPQPPAPQFSVPQPPPIKEPSANILLMAILGVVALLAGGFIVFLLMRR
jgi:hypothetical protein